jgi:putative ABC transport system permease protein
MKMALGRFFSREFSTDAAQAAVLNETAVKATGMGSPIGKRISVGDREGTIIGVMKDFHQSSLRNQIEPMIFWIREGGPRVCVKINSEHMPETIRFVESTWKRFVRHYPFTYGFLDENIDDLYKVERKIATAFQYSTLVAMCVACLGLLGLASFMAQRRTKEIGIRKVLGATVSNIVLLLSKEFGKWVLLANVIAWPIAYYAMNRWLESFAYRISIGWGTFALAGLFAFLMALITVSSQAIKAALANPVETLRYE